jgi:hypothetical protein
MSARALDVTVTENGALQVDVFVSRGVKGEDASGAGSTDLSLGTTTATTQDVDSSSGDNVTLIGAVANTAAGLITGAGQAVLEAQSGTNTGDQDLSSLALKSNVLELDNTDVFTPDEDYEPATKKYVDDNSGGGGSGDMTKVVYDPTTVEGDAFSMDNMAETATKKIFTSTERTKLTGVETGATTDQTGAEIKTAYEAETNAYTDTKNTKLNGIETGATTDQTGAEIKTAYEGEANAYTDTKNTKLAGIETAADVTDGPNVKTAIPLGYTVEQTLTSTSNITAFDASLGVEGLMTLTETTTLALPTNMIAGQTASIAGLQAAGLYAVSLNGSYTLMAGTLADIASLADGEAFEITIKRTGSAYRAWVTTQP